MELTIPAAPAQLAGLRQAARHALREVPPQVAEELILALDEAATNAILYGSRWWLPRPGGRLGPGRLGRGHRGGPRPSPATPTPTDHRSAQRPRPGAVAA
jgi:hypothetical protein